MLFTYDEIRAASVIADNPLISVAYMKNWSCSDFTTAPDFRNRKFYQAAAIGG